MSAREYERDAQQRASPAYPTHRPESPFGGLQGAGNRALAGLLAPRVQRFDTGEIADAGSDTAPAGEVETTEATGDAPVDEMAAAVAAGVDGGSTAALLQQDAAGQSTGGAIPATADGSGLADNSDTALGDDGASVQSVRADVQRDGTADPSQPRPASPGDLLDAVLALPSVKAVLDRLADFAIAQLKRAGAPATVTLATFSSRPASSPQTRGWASRSSPSRPPPSVWAPTGRAASARSPSPCPLMSTRRPGAGGHWEPNSGSDDPSSESGSEPSDCAPTIRPTAGGSTS